MKPNGYIMHEDAYRVIIATGFTRKSRNAKTGEMIQVWILAKKQNPVQAVETGHDKVNCGNCPLRGYKGQERSCYVNVGQAPLAVWKAWKRGSYPKADGVEMFRGRAVRFGAYGDPVHIPLPLAKSIAAVASTWTGYTHQWRNPLFAGWSRLVMASVETEADADTAAWKGWRTFRVSKTPPRANEVTCPSASTNGRVQCIKCGLCKGGSVRARSICIQPHGKGAAYVGQ